MATRHFCDKCGEQTQLCDLTSVSGLEASGSGKLFYERFYPVVPPPVQLCRRCVIRLRDWLKPDPKLAAAR